MNSRVRTLIAAGIGLVIVAGGFFAGSALGERASRPGTQTLTLERPAAAAPRDVALRSGAGFTGFEDGALGGAVTRSGTIAEGEDGAFAVETGSARLDVRATSPARLYRIAAGGGGVEAGDIVVVRVGEDGVAEAILRVPPDLREGDSR